LAKTLTKIKPKVKIYTTPSCPWCKKAKDFLKDNKINYTEYDVTSNDQARNEMIRLSGQSGVPVITIGGSIIIGYDPKAVKQALAGGK